MRRRRTIAPPINSAVPNNRAVTGSGTGAGAGSLGVFGLLKAWSGSFFGQPKLNRAAKRERTRIQCLGPILDSCFDAVQGRREVKDQFMFLIGIPSFYLKSLRIETELYLARRREGVERCRIWERKLSYRMIGVKCELTAISSQASLSIWQEFSDLRVDAAREVHRATLSGCFSIGCGSPDANHCALGSSVL